MGWSYDRKKRNKGVKGKEKKREGDEIEQKARKFCRNSSFKKEEREQKKLE